VLFTVLAVGSGTLSYRWLHDGVPVPGAAAPSLLVSSVQGPDTGAYQVVVSNSFGAVTSAPAILSLLVEPLITQPPLSQVVPVGSTVTLSVSVTNTATLPVGFRWRRGTANVPGGIFLLNQHTSFLVLTNVQQPLTNYSVVVTNIARPNGIISPTAILTLQTDSDGDGMPDAWELAHSLDPGWAGDRDQDLDMDGVTNGQEFEAGTLPEDRNSFLRVNLALEPGGALLTFGTVSNHTYSIRFQDGLGTGAWQRLADFVARPTNRVERITDPAPVSGRFYQVVSPRMP